MLRILLSAFILTVVVVGCGPSRNGGKYTDEELARMPLAKRSGLPNPSGGFVLAVGGETIKSDEIIAPLVDRVAPAARQVNYAVFRQQMREKIERIIENHIANILLYEKARAKAGERIDEAVEEMVKKEERKFVAEHGDDYAAAEEALQKQGMDWESFREDQKKKIISQSYLSSEFDRSGNRPITYSRIRDFYDEVKDEEYKVEPKLQFRLIDIRPEQLEGSGDTESAVEFCRELIERANGGEEFAALAKEYSHGHRAGYGGLWRQMRPDSLAAPYDILAEKSAQARDGEIVGPIVADGHVFVMKIVNYQSGGYKELCQVQDEIEERIRAGRRRKKIDELTEQLVSQAEVGRREEFIDYCVLKLYVKATGG